MRFLILAHVDDLTALRIAALLRARHGIDQVKLVSSEELLFAPHWNHRLDASALSSTLRLADGSRLSSGAIGVVLNRLCYVPLSQFDGATHEDQTYARAEMRALWLSWLAALPCPVVNPVSPIGLGAQHRSHAEWLSLAGQAGLPLLGYAFTTNPRLFPPPKGYQPHLRPTPTAGGPMPYVRLTTPSPGRQPLFLLEFAPTQQTQVLLAGSRVVGALATHYAPQLHRFAALAGADLLQVTFARSPLSQSADAATDGWKVAGATTFPQLDQPAAVAAVADLLEQKQLHL